MQTAVESSPNTSEAKLDAVIKGAKAILEEKTFQDAARAIFDQCCEITGAISGYVALLTPDGYENEVLFLEAGGMPCTVDESLPMPIRGLRAVAYETHAAAYDNDFMNSEWVKFMPDGHVDMQNVMFAPLNIEDKTVGIMGLANKPTDFTDEDAEIATVFGELAAIALTNSRYLDQLNLKNTELELALREIKTLRGLLPICSSCKSIRNEDGLWSKIEAYVTDNTDATFSHGLCPGCAEKLYPDLQD